jgi:chromosome segregation ATPase
MEQTTRTVKTYTERFQEMESQVQGMAQQYVEANQAFQVAANIVKELSGQIRMLNDQLQAIYELSEKGEKTTREAVASTINESRSKRVRQMLVDDEQAGVIAKKSTVTDGSDIIVFTSEDVSLAFQAVSAFDDATQAELLGKSTGTTAGGLTIESIYEIVSKPENLETATQS